MVEPTSDEPRPKSIEIDVRHKTSEWGWQGITDAFAMEATPKWFEWLGWVLTLAAFQYLARQSRSMLAVAISGVSICMLMLYFNAFFYRIEFKGLPLVRATRFERVASLVISGLLSWGCWLAARSIASAVAASMK